MARPPPKREDTELIACNMEERGGDTAGGWEDGLTHTHCSREDRALHPRLCQVLLTPDKWGRLSGWTSRETSNLTGGSAAVTEVVSVETTCCQTSSPIQLWCLLKFIKCVTKTEDKWEPP